MSISRPTDFLERFRSSFEIHFLFWQIFPLEHTRIQRERERERERHTGGENPKLSFLWGNN